MRIAGLQQVKDLLLLLIGSRRHLIVDGNSMLPTLKKDDVIIYKPYKPNKDTLYSGLLVVIRHPIKNDIYVKRIFKINSFQLDVRGDNEFESTDSRQFGIIHKRQVEGIVKKIISTSKTK